MQHLQKKSLHYILNYIKIPSACNNNYEMLQWLCENYDGEIHISGMTTKDETEDLVQFFIDKGRNKDLVLYIVPQGILPFEDVCLLDINLKQK
jgi:N-acetylneuraminate synthase